MRGVGYNQFFQLYALDISLALNHSATKTEVPKAMRGHILAGAELMGPYDRP